MNAMRYVACATGTSISRNIPPLDEDGNANRFKQAIAARCRDLKRNRPQEYRQLVSAEVSSLAKLAISDHDDVLLIGSDTKEGEICAEQLAELIENEFECNVQIRKVEGLQTIDPQAFRRRGVPELFRVLDRYAESLTGGDELILNVTGGFKAVVPYVTLYAMSKRYRVIYLFETAPKLIDLPPAPLSFDWNRVATVSDALLKLQRDELINSTEFERLIEHVSYDEKEWLECLWDRGDDLVWLSAFGQILASAMSSSEGVQVLLSPAASKTFERSTGAVREQYQFMLSRVSNPLQRAQHMHTIHGSDLLIWKRRPMLFSLRRHCSWKVRKSA
jgi:putative CRISPR-associated protein (TIGR02619 family)